MTKRVFKQNKKKTRALICPPALGATEKYILPNKKSNWEKFGINSVLVVVSISERYNIVIRKV